MLKEKALTLIPRYGFTQETLFMACRELNLSPSYAGSISTASLVEEYLKRSEKDFLLNSIPALSNLGDFNARLKSNLLYKMKLLEKERLFIPQIMAHTPALDPSLVSSSIRNLLAHSSTSFEYVYLYYPLFAKVAAVKGITELYWSSLPTTMSEQELYKELDRFLSARLSSPSIPFDDISQTVSGLAKTYLFR